MDSGLVSNVMEGHKGPITSLFYSSNHKCLFSTSMDGHIKVWASNGKQIQSINVILYYEMINW